ncbi:type I-F CRISPR-associated protein Csy2 [Desulfonatronum sp. SC1]|uniref:type I-F CRISPR-associated protein Csy2 n=1 Tax=Desulfonatronum sp. SC1 TaxID=2109626 RepID=UPI000D31B971|nr:type I-F CRISPR-associated protein Csy2 [Desulfonatronum sp. SC1]PTN35183.1 type I-F CRISPR-associated protein Csy2 [Desulfonatronum sp. SC1]
MDSYLVIQKMDVTEASMDSCPIVNGFPGVPAIMGFVHALQRKLQSGHPGILLPLAGISCHYFDPGVHKTGRETRLSLSKNPPYLKKHVEKDKNGLLKGVPFIEEGKADMRVSLIIKILGEDLSFKDLQKGVQAILPLLRFAGGTIWGAENIVCRNCGDEEDERHLLRLLMPGFVLVERRDLIEQSMEDGKDALDALLDHLEVRRVEDENGQTVGWGRKTEEPGWLVPIAVGYRAISETGQVKNQRDPEYPHCFAENVVTLGEFVMPIRLDRLGKVLWQSNVDEASGLFVYTNQNKGE